MPTAAFRFTALRRFYDHVVDHLALLLLFIVVGGLVAGYTVKKMQDSASENLLLLTALAVAGGSAIILKWKNLAELKWAVETGLKSLLYRFARIGTPLGGAEVPSGWAQLLVNENFLSISFKRADQRDIAEKVVAALGKGKKFFVVEGESGVGKTATAIVIIDRLLCEQEFLKLTRKIYYLDLAVHGNNFDNLLRQANASFLNQASLIIDNFHRIPADRLEAFNRFIRRTQLPCQMLLVLSQPRKYFTLCPEDVIAPFRQAEADDTFFALDTPDPIALRSVFKPSNEFDDITLKLNMLAVPDNSPIRWLAHVNWQRLHQVSAANMDRAVQDLLLMRDMNSDRPEDRDTLKVLATITVLSIHRGVFTAADLKTCLKAVQPFNLSDPLEWFYLKRCFNRLRRQGLGLEAIGQRRVYVFHQALAEHLKDRLNASGQFRRAFQAAGEAMLTVPWVGKDSLLAWLLAVELGKDEAVRTGFPAAMVSGAFGLMRRAMQRNPANAEGMRLTYERALLAERVGDWADARQGLAAATRERDRSMAWAWATIASVEAEHGDDSLDRLNAVLNTEGVTELVRVAARYWCAHLAAHQGRFEVEILADLTRILEENEAEFTAESKFEYIHISRRVLFDHVRFLYLLGESSGDNVYSLFSRKLAIVLEREHPCFTSYRQKFLVSHSIHYQHLYERVVLKKKPSFSKQTLLLAGVSGKPEPDRDQLAAAAMDAYQKAIEGFAVFGDKTSEYIKPRLLEVRLAQPDVKLEHIRLSLGEYRQFIAKTGFKDLDAYPHLYDFKYFIRKAACMLVSGGPAGDDGRQEHDRARKKATAALIEATKAFEQAKNAYGLAMCQLFRAAAMLGSRETQAEAKAVLESVRTVGVRNGYKRISETVDVLTDPDISMADVNDVIAYFPIIHQ
ncbi:P-loop NTPase family protein [Azospirillum argentinense]